MFLISPFVVSVVAWRRWRFLLDDFLVRMWLLKARIRFTFPDPVSLKRFFAPLWVFIFGIAVPFVYECRASSRGLSRSRYFGARIMVMNFPSNFGSLSILETSAS